MIDFPNPTLDELRAIRKLLVLGLQKLDLATQDEIAKALGVDRSAVSRALGGKTLPKQPSLDSDATSYQNS